MSNLTFSFISMPIEQDPNNSVERIAKVLRYALRANEYPGWVKPIIETFGLRK